MNVLDKASRMIHGVRVLSDWIGDGGIVVAQEDAQKRADVCISCPLNQKSNTVSDKVAANIKRQRELKSQLELRVTGEKSLYTCQACLCNLPLKVWIPTQNLKLGENKETLSKYDANCWMRKEIAV
jgi:hypothetical protein